MLGEVFGNLQPGSQVSLDSGGILQVKRDENDCVSKRRHGRGRGAGAGARREGVLELLKKRVEKQWGMGGMRDVP